MVIEILPVMCKFNSSMFTRKTTYKMHWSQILKTIQLHGQYFQINGIKYLPLLVQILNSMLPVHCGILVSCQDIICLWVLLTSWCPTREPGHQWMWKNILFLSLSQSTQFYKQDPCETVQWESTQLVVNLSLCPNKLDKKKKISIKQIFTDIGWEESELYWNVTNINGLKIPLLVTRQSLNEKKCIINLTFWIFFKKLWNNQ